MPTHQGLPLGVAQGQIGPLWQVARAGQRLHRALVVAVWVKHLAGDGAGSASLELHLRQAGAHGGGEPVLAAVLLPLLADHRAETVARQRAAGGVSARVK